MVSLAETTKLHAVSGLDRTVKRIEQVVSLVSKPLGVGAYGLKKPRGMKWRSSAWFLTAVVCIGVMSDLLAYVRYDDLALLTHRLSLSLFSRTDCCIWAIPTWQR